MGMFLLNIKGLPSVTKYRASLWLGWRLTWKTFKTFDWQYDVTILSNICWDEKNTAQFYTVKTYLWNTWGETNIWHILNKLANRDLEDSFFSWIRAIAPKFVLQTLPIPRSMGLPPLVCCNTTQLPLVHKKETIHIHKQSGIFFKGRMDEGGKKGAEHFPRNAIKSHLTNRQPSPCPKNCIILEGILVSSKLGLFLFILRIVFATQA